MGNMIYLVIEDDDTIIKASLDCEYIENLCEEHMYEMRARAMQALGLDDDGNEKDITDADIYAAQNYPFWSVGRVSKKACEQADGGDVTVYIGNCDENEMSSAEILELLKNDDAEEEFDSDFW